MTEKQRICILGGGFGGLYTALRLSQLPWEKEQQPEIVLVDKSDRFLFAPLLYELVTEELQTWEIAPPFEEILADTGIVFYQASVTDIDIEAKRVKLDHSSELTYTKLVIAMGGKTPLNTVPGAILHAIPFRTLNDAYRLREELRLLEQSNRDKIRVAVVGGGYSGVELACKIADRLGDKGRIRIIERGDKILKDSSQFNQEAATKALEKRKIWLDVETEVEQVEADSISLAYKGKVDTIPVDLVLWTVGNQVSEFMRKLPLPQDSQGLLKTNANLQVLEHEDIFALGDIASCQDATGQLVPATAQVAFQQSDYCAWNLWASMSDRPLLPFRYQPLGEMMTLGVDNASISGLGLNLDGSLAYIARRLIYLYRLPTLKHQLTVGFNWITQPLVELLT
ncbi:FAD-dependent pyridine nucleotide-disulfide oxidoreductase [Stanieria cyanosphaera PCC 7437]|uniref:demethylphylloquinone reductase n=1 Tax=Stanieria cyanosphaera (strain ATCC 29371 / PCC 7437) TaxID=111780 RepID=K9XX92_STAC7|nr:NAD(P)/FAD-dependent oxidoreductase [Stanieria cyanosphaera]AFZ37138.1 FAD-dependent pyridine nucleotide-disulfide oxidoreductase [Stanieria cyanosphaera PCC 7437]